MGTSIVVRTFLEHMLNVEGLVRLQQSVRQNGPGISSFLANPLSFSMQPRKWNFMCNLLNLTAQCQAYLV